MGAGIYLVNVWIPNYQNSELTLSSSSPSFYLNSHGDTIGKRRGQTNIPIVSSQSPISRIRHSISQERVPLGSFQFTHSLQRRVFVSLCEETRSAWLVIDCSGRSLIVPSTATSLPLWDPGRRHRRGVDLVDIRREIRGGDSWRAAWGWSSRFARRQVVASRMVAGLPVAMLAEGTAVSGDPASTAGLQGGPTTIPTTLKKEMRIRALLAWLVSI